jgi:hypothetical protein
MSSAANAQQKAELVQIEGYIKGTATAPLGSVSLTALIE